MKEVKSTTSELGKTVDLVYVEDNPLNNFEGRSMASVRAYCFCNGKFVIVRSINTEGQDYWVPPGGGIDQGENFTEATIREIKEEANMKVLKLETFGYLDIYDDGKIFRQVMSVCIVEPYGDFVSDPAGDIVEVKLIDPADCKQYFDWGETGDARMQRALELLPTL